MNEQSHLIPCTDITSLLCVPHGVQTDVAIYNILRLISLVCDFNLCPDSSR